LKGIADISNVLGRLITYIGQTVVSRLVSIVNYAGKTRINPMINTIISLIPDQFTLPGTSIEVEGGISDELKVVKDQYMMIPLDLSFQNLKAPYTKHN